MAASYGAPGVYVEEQPSGSKPIEGVSTAVAAFVGFTAEYHAKEGDPRDADGVQPQLVTSWDQYERVYGGFVAGAMLPHAVNGFFLNGGTKAFIVRIPRGGPVPAAATVGIPTSGRADVESLRVEALDPAATDLQVAVERPEPPPEGGEPSREFTLRVLQGGQQREEFTGLTLGGRRGESLVPSALVKVLVQQASGVSGADRLPVAGAYPVRPAAPAPAVTAGPVDLEGSSEERTGYKGLVIADLVSMVAVPDLVTVTTRADGTLDEDAYVDAQGRLVDWCEASRTKVAILDPPPGLRPTQVLAWRQRLNRSSAYAAAYYPQLVVADPTPIAGPRNGARFITVPPSGHVAGVWARTDSDRGVWKAPANEVVRGVSRLALDVTVGEQDLLNPEGVNCIRAFGSNGLRIWGARTLATKADPAWRYLPVRRLFIFVEESIRQGMQWAVFEPNGEDLWQRVKRTITAFLRDLWRQGALAGATPAQAFYVRCDENNNPPDSVAQGKLVVEVGICPVKPAEFVIFKISQWEGGSETTE